MGRLKKLIYLSGIYSIGSLFQAAMGFMLIPVYTTYLATSDYGIVALMGITAGIMQKFIVPPVANGFVRYYHSPDYKDRKGLLLFNSFCLLTILAVVIALVFYSLAHIISRLILGDNGLIYVVELYAYIVFIAPLSFLLFTFLRQEQKGMYVVVVSWGMFLASAGVTIFGLVYQKIGVVALIYGSLAGEVLSVVCILPLFWKYSTPAISLSVLRPPLRYGCPLIVQGFSLSLINFGDRYVLKLFYSLSDVGLYSFGSSFGRTIDYFVITPTAQAIQPLALELEAEPEKLRSFLRRSCTYFYTIGMFVWLSLSLYSKEVIQILASRQEFWGSYVIVPVIGLCCLQYGLGGFFNFGLALEKKVYQINRNVLVAVSVNIVLNFIFVPYWGIKGAAVATLISHIVWNGLRTYYSAKFYSLYFDLGRLCHITTIGVGLYLSSLLLASTDSMVLGMSIKFVILVLYPVTVFLSGFFTKEERGYLTELWGSLRIEGMRVTYARIKGL